MTLLLQDDLSSVFINQLNDPDQNQKGFDCLAAMKGKDFSGEIEFNLPDGYELKIAFKPNADSEFNIMLLNYKTKRVSYFISVEKIKRHIENIQKKPLCHIRFFRVRTGEDNRVTRDLTEAVIFKYLVHHFNLAIINSKESLEVRRMYEGLMFKAIQSKDHLVAFPDTGSASVQFITDEKQLHSKLQWLWGNQDIDQGHFGVIAKM